MQNNNNQHIKNFFNFLKEKDDKFNRIKKREERFIVVQTLTYRLR